MPDRIIFVGPSGAGKTALVKRYHKDTFDDEPLTEQVTTTVNVGSSKVDVVLQHEIDVMSDDLSGVVGVVYVFDCTSQENFDALAPMEERVRGILPEVASLMCANKVEDELEGDRVVSFLGCKEIYSGKVPVFETSANTGKNIKAVFDNLKMLVGADMAASAPAPAEKSGGGSGGGGAKKKKGCLVM
eukprot:TRINITY_DN3138_c3_g1_i1.p1 TRINITY_DN3138_c3_g1~~TRINITY_DN3138_c3_g1_i1.p1  ORF type:complete len:197 (-),score=70.48 TRINITY_DN3138_c3_g1_i1:121-681(-)